MSRKSGDDAAFADVSRSVEMKRAALLAASRQDRRADFTKGRL